MLSHSRKEDSCESPRWGERCGAAAAGARVRTLPVPVPRLRSDLRLGPAGSSSGSRSQPQAQVLQQQARTTSGSAGGGRGAHPPGPRGESSSSSRRRRRRRTRVWTPEKRPPAGSKPGTVSFERAAGKALLYENPWTIPNLLCMARMGLAPVLGYLIVEQYFHLSLGLFVLAGATDLLDGYIARNWANQKSALGSALDPLADKILISVLYVSLTYASLIPAPLTALVISRDVALIAAVFYVRYKTIPPPRTLSKYFNPCYATAQLKPTLISKVNTVVQLVLAAATLAAPVFHYTDSAFLQALWLITALTTAASGYSYYHYGKKTVEVLNRTK
ncbi:cardiolipin synthase (CMP-forming) isoform X2 [Scleropages formosus]|uniref:cardiolipin synthase (CMP-forming) isoform X2 n=1 Tax=Scleropages formosus TaxID=113540 RepID=UPI0010FA6BFE|nr:cardiolipin synthase (CMP-forming) isoform X2 [Scleropages formosus]